MKHLLYLLCLALAFAGCSRDDDTLSSDKKHAVAVSVTRGGTGDTGEQTYRVLLFNPLSGLYTGQTGTYYYDFGSSDESVSRVLIPCNVDTAGNRTGDGDITAALYTSAGSYSMVIASPAVAMEQVSVSPNRWGFHYLRKPEAEAKPLYISDSVSVTVVGRSVALPESGNTEYGDTLHVDTRSGKLLRERRARMGFAFKCGEEIDHTSLSKIELRNIIDEAYYDPVKNYFFNETVSSVTLFANEEPLHIYRGDEAKLFPSPVDADAEGRYLSMLAQDYSTQNIYGEYIHPLPVLHIGFASDAQVDIRLGYNMLPHYKYTYT
ncbi:MAG: hypothetical protein ACI35M_03510, partial [Alistipes sp.]